MSAPGESARAELAMRLQARRSEMRQATLTRVYAVSDIATTEDSEYMEGLRAAVSAALDYGLLGIERGAERSPPVPIVLLRQARRAARSGVSLDTVLRRYLAGYTLLGDFVIEEAERGGLASGVSLKRLMRTQGVLFDRLLAAVSEEYLREAEIRPSSAEQRRVESVQGLLNGELVDTADLAYDFDAHHLGLVAAGPRAPQAFRSLAGTLDRRLLLARRGEGAVWAWLGGRRRIDLDQVERQLGEHWPAQTPLALGEPGQGLTGWRLTHRQANAALPIALHTRKGFIRYGDVAILAAALGDDLLATSLQELYLAPLACERDGGQALRLTLHAYFAADRNVSSAAAALEVSRQTVTNRLRLIEERLERPLTSCATAIETALRLEDLGPA